MGEISDEAGARRLKQLDARTLLAIRWYERAGSLESSDDRYLALWLALEAVAGGPGTDFLKRVWDLVVQALGGVVEADRARHRIDIRGMRDLRNRVVAGTAREVAPTDVEYSASARTLRLLGALIADSLRTRIGLAPSRELASALAD